MFWPSALQNDLLGSRPMTSGCVVQVVGARPNFVKMAPVIAALEDRPGISQRVVHAGQHYDERLSAEMLLTRVPEPTCS